MNLSLSDQLTETIANREGIELSSEILEFSIDQALDDGLLKDIPIVGWISKGLSLSKSISDRIFYHKVVRFLIALKKESKHDSESFRQKILEDKKYNRRVGEHLILILDKMEDFDKPELTAQVFSCFLSGDIDHDYFIELASVIQRSSLADLKVLSVGTNERIAFRNRDLAAASGILSYGIQSFEESEPELATRFSVYGRDLRDIFLGRLRESKKSRPTILRRQPIDPFAELTATKMANKSE